MLVAGGDGALAAAPDGRVGGDATTGVDAVITVLLSAGCRG